MEVPAKVLRHVYACLTRSWEGPNAGFSCREALGVVRHYASTRKVATVPANGVYGGAISGLLEKFDCEKYDPIIRLSPILT